MPSTPQDLHFMRQALEQAQAAMYLTSPNPRVGCILVNARGEVIGAGHTQMAGFAHAEICALNNAQAQGLATEGASAYVTLEPCAHTGRTPPCTNALIRAGVRRVLASHLDPNPLVRGKGFEQLRSAGIDVQVGLLEAEARELNIGFIKRMTCGVPWVRLKVASSLDGATALTNGVSQWITGEEARAHAHTWRARSCAVMSAIGTVVKDDPALNVRGVSTPRQPRVVIIDPRLETPTSAKLFQTSREVIIYCAASGTQRSEQKRALSALGACVVELPYGESGQDVDLRAVLADLGQRQINELHVEGGAGLNTRLIEAGLVDEYLAYMAPKIIGRGKGWTHWPESKALESLEALPKSQVLRFCESSVQGGDLFLRARPENGFSNGFSHSLGEDLGKNPFNPTTALPTTTFAGSQSVFDPLTAKESLAEQPVSNPLGTAPH